MLHKDACKHNSNNSIFFLEFFREKFTYFHLVLNQFIQSILLIKYFKLELQNLMNHTLIFFSLLKYQLIQFYPKDKFSVFITNFKFYTHELFILNDKLKFLSYFRILHLINKLKLIQFLLFVLFKIRKLLFTV